MIIEDYLHKIDTALKEKQPKEIYMLYLIIFGLIFSLSYMLFWETSLQGFTHKHTQIEYLKTKLQLDNEFLNAAPEAKIVSLEKKIKKLESDLVDIRDKNTYIKTKIEDISTLVYDDKRWGEYLDSISQDAQLYNIKILDFGNKFAQKNRNFGHILDISLQISANYKDTLSFINSLEQSELVVDIHQLNINKEETLISDINISVWGISY